MQRKPGDWNCPACNALVFASKHNCFKCGTAKPMGSNEYVREGDWLCTKCNFLVYASKSSCFKCGSMRPHSSHPSHSPYSSYPQSHRRGPQYHEFKAGDWMCPACNDHVFARKNNCGKCNAPRPAVPAQPQHACVICSQAPSEYACIPCGHKVLCEQHKNSAPACPVCEQPINSVIKIIQQ